MSLSRTSKVHTELAGSHLRFVLQTSPVNAFVQSEVEAHAGLATQPLSAVQYWPAGHAVAPVAGPIECWQVPATQASTVHERPSSQDVAHTGPLPAEPPAAIAIDPPLPGLAELEHDATPRSIRSTLANTETSVLAET
jgi:hypothetical protein